MIFEMKNWHFIMNSIKTSIQGTIFKNINKIVP